nr:PREDICTED: uncharacterized protein LOC105662145 isoform X4 [Megachile rotundata]
MELPRISTTSPQDFKEVNDTVQYNSRVTEKLGLISKTQRHPKKILITEFPSIQTVP